MDLTLNVGNFLPDTTERWETKTILPFRKWVVKTGVGNTKKAWAALCYPLEGLSSWKLVLINSSVLKEPQSKKQDFRVFTRQSKLKKPF